MIDYANYESEYKTGRDFFLAVAKHFGIDSSKLGPMSMATDLNSPLAVNMTVFLSADDIKAIGEAMKESKQ